MINYDILINVRDGVAARIPVPDYLVGLYNETLADLTWIDPAFPAYGSVWWPQEFTDGELLPDHKWGAETYTVVPERQVVQVQREQVPLSQAELDARRAAELSYMTPLVDMERDRRVNQGFVYNGKAYLTESQSQRDDILGKLGDSLAAITVDGAQPGNLRWAHPDRDFAWSAADGTPVPMDAQTCLQFTRAAVRRKEILVAAALLLKDMNPVPLDYADDKWWPQSDATQSRSK